MEPLQLLPRFFLTILYHFFIVFVYPWYMNLHSVHYSGLAYAAFIKSVFGRVAATCTVFILSITLGVFT